MRDPVITIDDRRAGVPGFRASRRVGRRERRGTVLTLDAVGACCIALCGLISTTLALRAADGAEARAPITLQVCAMDGLLSLNPVELSHYLALRMTETQIPAWRFVAEEQAKPQAPDRVEWSFRLKLYAGGSVRTIVPLPRVERFRGVHRPVAIEVRLYLHGDYQTAVFGQATIEVGDEDRHLADVATHLAQTLLGETGAYRSIETAPPSPQ